MKSKLIIYRDRIGYLFRFLLFVSGGFLFGGKGSFLNWPLFGYLLLAISTMHLVLILSFPVFIVVGDDLTVKMNYFFFWPKKFKVSTVANFEVYIWFLGIVKLSFLNGSSLFIWANSLSDKSVDTLKKLFTDNTVVRNGSTGE
jgi:hypothetical protein